MSVKNGSRCITYSKFCHGFPISIGGKTQGCFSLRTLGCSPPFQKGNEMVLWYIFIASGTRNFLIITINPLIIYLFHIIYPIVYEIDQDRDYIVHCCLLGIQNCPQVYEIIKNTHRMNKQEREICLNIQQTICMFKQICLNILQHTI